LDFFSAAIPVYESVAVLSYMGIALDCS